VCLRRSHRKAEPLSRRALWGVRGGPEDNLSGQRGAGRITVAKGGDSPTIGPSTGLTHAAMLIKWSPSSICAMSISGSLAIRWRCHSRHSPQTQPATYAALAPCLRSSPKRFSL
jgi:hypothetical protein